MAGDLDMDAFWEALRERMPVHDCGRRLEPGGTAAAEQVLVCPPCSHVEAADPVWVTTVVNGVLLDLQAGTADAGEAS